MPARGRTTRQAFALDEMLRSQDGFRSALELYTSLRQQGERIGLTTVYRHLNLLVELGEADVVLVGDGESRFRLCGEGVNGTSGAVSHHHLVCRACGRAVEVSDPRLERWATQVAKAAGYTDVTHRVEVFGLCPHH
jgi:Fur family transcriptional regulator, ferric uptake regulator